MHRVDFLRFAALALVVHIGIASSYAPAEEPNPYGSHVVTAPPRSPNEQLQTFHLPPGFTIELVAAEPDIHKPINLAFDAAGYLYATGSVEYPYPAADGKPGRDVVMRFVVGAGGRATESRAVVSGLNIPIGLAAVDRSLLVYSIPQVLRCYDADGDGRFKQQRPLVRGFGFRDTHGMVNGIAPWIDGWIYSCHGFSNESLAEGTDGSKIAMQSGNTFRWKPDGSQVQHYTHGQVNPFGLAFDEWGHLFSADCHTLPAYQLLRGAWYPSFGKPHDGLGYGPAIMKHQHGSTGIAGIVYYEADQFPEEYRRTLFIGNPITGRINHDKLERTGASYRAIEQPDFLTCDDPWFRPVDIKLGPDGALYVADFYNCIIGHYEVPLDHPKRDRERGRIWRIRYEGKQKELPPLTRTGFDELLRMLGQANLTVRTFATQRLAMMKLSNVQRAAVAEIIRTGDSAAQRVHALWALQRGYPQDVTVELLSRLCGDSASLVRAHAATVLGERNGETAGEAGLARLRELLADPEPFVVLAAAEALAKHPAEANITPLLAAWKRTSTADTHLTHALRIALREQLVQNGAFASVQVAASAGEDRLRLVEICLGVPQSAAADYVLETLQASDDAVAAIGPYVEHIARHLDAQRLPALYAWCDKFAAAPIDHRLAIYRGLLNALGSRKLSAPQNITTGVAAIVLELLRSSEEGSVKRGLELAQEFRKPEFFADVAKRAERDSVFESLRAAALEACTACDGSRAAELLTAVVEDGKEPRPLQGKAVQLLAGLNTDTARKTLLARLATAPERLALEIAASLAASPAGAEALLTAVTGGKASARLLQDTAVQRWLRRANPPGWETRVKLLTRGLPAGDDRLAQLITSRFGAYRTGKPDAERGRAVFTKTCAACHRVAGQGTKLGPELDGVGRRGVERLLEDVLDPNRNVDQAFRATQFTLVDGRLLTGLALRKEGDVVIVADAQGKEVRLASGEIEEQNVLNLSPMPANVSELVPEADFVDLIGFLMTLEKPAVAASEK